MNASVTLNANPTAVAPTLATDLLPSDTIIATLTSRSADNKLIRISHTWNGNGVEVDGNGNPLEDGVSISVAASPQQTLPPVFDAAGYRKALDANDKKAADALSQQYLVAVQEYRGAGEGLVTLADRIRAAVYAAVSSTHDISAADRPSGMVLREDQVQVRVPLRYGNQPVVFTVSMAPVWG